MCVCVCGVWGVVCVWCVCVVCVSVCLFCYTCEDQMSHKDSKAEIFDFVRTFGRSSQGK